MGFIGRQINSGLSKNSIFHRIGRHPLLFSVITHIIIILGLYTILNYKIYSDPGTLERWFALNILNAHQLPYRDFITEYPPLAILSFVLPAFFFREPFSYNLAFAVEILIADLIILVLLSRLSTILKIPIWETLGGYTIFILVVGPLVTARHDMIPALLVMLAFYALITKKNRTAWMLLGLGVMTKVFPLIYVPLFAVLYLHDRRYSDLVNGINSMVTTIFLLALPWLIIDAEGFFSFLTYHVQRGVQGESIYASILLIGQLFGLTNVENVYNYGSWNLTSPLADNMATASSVIMVGLLVISYLLAGFAFWRRRNLGEIDPIKTSDLNALLLQFALLITLILIITDKVLSPQYLIWLCPLMALITGKLRNTIWIMFAVAGICTQFIFPHNYAAYQAVETLPVLVETLRNLLLVAMAILLVIKSLKPYTGKANLIRQMQ